LAFNVTGFRDLKHVLGNDLGKVFTARLSIPIEGNLQIGIKGKEIFNGEYSGELPKSATSRDLSQ